MTTTEADSIRWREWGASTFAGAAREQKPVLLALGPAWCQWTDEMDRVGYRDPDVVQLVNDRFVPVRVDADRRPDISERYTVRGWPTTAFLTPEGGVLGGGTYLEPARLISVLRQVDDAFAACRGHIEARSAAADDARNPAPPDPGEIETDAGQWLETLLTARFDRTWAGFGSGAKQIHPAALLAALRRTATAGTTPLTDILTRTLDAIANGGLADPVEGGFFRYCDQPDWSAPHTEKLLSVNARLIELYLAAAGVLERPDYADLAAATIRFVHRTFADPDGGFFANQRADAAYAALATPEARLQYGAPPVDRTIYTDASALMASVYTTASQALDDRSLIEFAAATVDRVVMETYERGGGVGHAVTGAPAVRGLLTDQVAASEALLDLYDLAGQDVYLDTPQELMLYCAQQMWDDGAGFRDRVRADLPDADAPIGLLCEPHHPFALNCRAAVVLARLAAHTGDRRFHSQSRQTLASQATRYQAHGLDGADYALALEKIALLE